MDLLILLTHNRLFVKVKACSTFTIRGCNPRFGYCVFMEHQCVRIGPLIINCRQGQATEFLLLCYKYLLCEIYHLAMVYIDISDC